MASDNRRKPRFRKAPEDPQPASFYMDDALKRLGIDFSDPRGRLFSDWENLGFGDVSKHCSPVSLKNGCLGIKCETGAWASLLQMRKAEILRTVREKYPSLEIRTLKIFA